MLYIIRATVNEDQTLYVNQINVENNELKSVVLDQEIILVFKNKKKVEEETRRLNRQTFDLYEKGRPEDKLVAWFTYEEVR